VHQRVWMTIAIVTAGLVAGRVIVAQSASDLPNRSGFPNGSGVTRTFSTAGHVDPQGPFFQSLGTNGRACGTCHDPAEGWSVSAAGVERRFRVSRGADPIFRANDGSDCPGQGTYTLLRSRGLFRVSLPIPQGAQFELESVLDPFGCNSRSSDIGLYRRPLPSANLAFLTTVMWDGRETLPGQTLDQSLAHQAVTATLGHAEGLSEPTVAQQAAIVAFERSLFVAQAHDRGAGNLNADNAIGGPESLANEPFYPGINDPVGLNPTGAPFTPVVFTLFHGWAHSSDPGKRLIAAGERIFNTRQFVIADVPGLNDRFLEGAPLTSGTCTICHDTPNVGNHSAPAPLDIGVADPKRAPFLPVYRFLCNSGPMAGRSISTTDPGRAMITGQCADIGKLKGPILRALASRAPYFHNGSARTLSEVVEFYDSRFSIRLTPLERAALVAFLSAL
jgi:cytochrome c peroxidase